MENYASFRARSTGLRDCDVMGILSLPLSYFTTL